MWVYKLAAWKFESGIVRDWIYRWVTICSVRCITIRYSPLYNRSVFNPISIRFKANSFKGLFPPVLVSKNIVYATFGENLFHFKTKSLKPTASVLNTPPIKRWVFHRIEKKLSHGGTTAICYELVQDGLISKLLSLDASKWTQANTLKGLNHIIPHKLGKIRVFHSGTVISWLYRNVKSQLFANCSEIVSL